MKRHPWLVRGRWKFRRGFGKKPGIPAGRPAVHSADNVSELVTREKLGRIYFGRRDYVDPEMVILNVKALGYEIARLLAERTASERSTGRPISPSNRKSVRNPISKATGFFFGRGK